MNNNYNIALSALKLFSDGLSSNNHFKIREALNMTRTDEFSWDGLEVLKIEWDQYRSEFNNRYQKAKSKLN